MPIFDNVRVNELDPDTQAWFTSILETIESLDVSAYVASMSADVELVMDGGSTRMRGRDEVRAGLTKAWSGLANLVHDETNIYGSSNRFVHETVTHVVTTNGQRVDTPQCVWIDRDDAGRISSARIY